MLARNYDFDEARVVLREMVDASVLDLVEKGVVCGHISLSVGHAVERSWDDAPARTFTGEHGTRRIGRDVPRSSASRKLGELTNSRSRLSRYFLSLYDEVVDPNRPIRRLSIGMGGLLPEELSSITLFTDPQAEGAEHRLAEATIAVKRRFGKNALVRGISYRRGATGLERNVQVGGHHE